MRVPTLPPAFRTPYVADDTRTCYACGHETTEALKTCPACGSTRFLTGRAVRRRGWVLVVLGSLLAATGLGLTAFFWEVLHQTGRPGATTTFTGTPEEAALIYGVFGFVAALGGGAVFGGAWQIRYGRPNRAVVAVAFALAVALLLAVRSRRLIGL